MTNYEHGMRRPTDYNDGKIHGWNGGDCPVYPETEVRTWFRDGDISNEKAVLWSWSHDGAAYDIIAFQVTKEYHEPKTIWVNEYKDYYTSHTSERSAREFVGTTATRIAVKYVEVIE